MIFHVNPIGVLKCFCKNLYKCLCLFQGWLLLFKHALLLFLVKFIYTLPQALADACEKVQAMPDYYQIANLCVAYGFSVKTRPSLYTNSHHNDKSV